MTTSRLEAFSDGVLAIIITIMVLELPRPEEFTFHALVSGSGLALIGYLVSFIYVGIYWNNHHHLFQIADKVDGRVLWANLGLLFALSLMPFATAWMAESELSQQPVALYALVLLAAAIMFAILEKALLVCNGQDSRIGRAISHGWKERISLVLYSLAVISAFVDTQVPGRAGTMVAVGCFVLVAAIWLIPDRRLERSIAQDAN